MFQFLDCNSQIVIYKTYIKRFVLADDIIAPLKALNLDAKYTVVIKTLGGGLTGQAEACQLGIARALLLMNEEFRIQLSPVTLQSFYSTKGDDFLQIDDLGLYKLNDRFGIAVPFFDELDFTASAKFHIKSHGDSYTFNIALRADELDRDRSRISPLNLSRKEDANRFLRAL